MGTPVTNAKAKPFEPTQGRDELNFAEFPLFFLGQRVPSDTTELHFESEITDSVRNNTIRRRISIVAGTAAKIPLSRDMDVLHALIALGKHTNDFSEKVVYFTRYQLCSILGWPHNGKSYKRIEEALRKWLELTIYFDAWWDKGDERWRKLTGFHILDEFQLNEVVSKGQGKQEKPLLVSWVSFSDKIFKSLHDGNVKRLNLADLFHLQLPTAKRLYGFLDKRFYHKTTLDFDLKTLACEHVGLSRDYKPSELKRKLFPAIEELVAIGFLKPMAFEDRYVKVSHGVYRIYFARQKRQQIGTLPLSGGRKEKTLLRGLIKELTDLGVNPTVARKLVESGEHTEAEIRLQIEVLVWKQSEEDQPPIENPGGYLRKMITDGHNPPPNFVSTEERERRRNAAEQITAKRLDQQRQREADLARIEANRKALEAQRRERTERHLAALPDDDREAFIEAAIEGALPIARQKARRFLNGLEDRNSGAYALYEEALDNHVERMLGSMVKPDDDLADLTAMLARNLTLPKT